MGDVIELSMFFAYPSVSSEYLQSMQLLIANVKVHFEIVNNIWRRMGLRSMTVTEYVKTHNMDIYPYQIEEVGIISAAWCTSIGESCHKLAKIYFPKTSKRGGCSDIELAWKDMTVRYARRLYAKRVSNPIPPPLTELPQDDEGIYFESDVYGCGKQRVFFAQQRIFPCNES